MGGKVQTIDEDWNDLAKSFMFKDERHMYEVLYEQEGLTVAEIASRLGCGTATLNRRMSAYKIKKRLRGGHRKGLVKIHLLFYADQRVVIGLKCKALAERFGVSYSIAYHYKRWKAQGSLSAYRLSAIGRKTNLEGLRS